METRDLDRNRIDQALLARAFNWALMAHREDRRKAPEPERERIAYVSHLMQVAGLVLEHGGSIEQAIAGLLHDTVEDQDHIDLSLVRRDFGDAVAQMVDDCTDAYERPKPAWETRKQQYVERLAAKARDGKPSALVSACDKLHNLGTLVADVDAEGLGYLRSFNAPPDRTHWYYSALFDAYLEAPDDVIPVRLRKSFAHALRHFTRLLQAGGHAVVEPGSIKSILGDA